MRPDVLAMALAFLLGGTSGRAHHSYADFYDHEVSVEGTLEKVVFANPHTILTVRAKDATVYTGNWRAAFQLNTMGVKPTDLAVGDVIVMSGTPSRDAAAHQLARLSEVRRPTDGWSWRRDRAVNGNYVTTPASH
jgi:Family of unknown function (DUF6152)